MAAAGPLAVSGCIKRSLSAQALTSRLPVPVVLLVTTNELLIRKHPFPMTEQSNSKRTLAGAYCMIDLLTRELLRANRHAGYPFLSRFLVCLFGLFLFRQRAFCFFSSIRFLELQPSLVGHSKSSAQTLLREKPELYWKIMYLR